MHALKYKFLFNHKHCLPRTSTPWEPKWWERTHLPWFKLWEKCSCILMLWKKCSYEFLVKCLKVIAKSCLNWIIFHGSLYCCVRYSNIEYQDEIIMFIYKFCLWCPQVYNGFKKYEEKKIKLLNTLDREMYVQNQI